MTCVQAVNHLGLFHILWNVRSLPHYDRKEVVMMPVDYDRRKLGFSTYRITIASLLMCAMSLS